MKTPPYCWLVVGLALALSGCSRSTHGVAPAPGPPRGFRMAMVAFPGEATPAAFIEVFDFIGGHCDMLANHHDNGVPWDSALAGRPPAADVVNEFAYRRDRAAQLGLRTYLALSWLDADRDTVGAGWGRGPRPGPIAAAPDFANPDVRRALKYWCAWAATFSHPDAFAAGVEINYYALHNPADWPNLVSLYREVYDTLKTIRPAMQVFPTFQLDELWRHDQWSLLPAFNDKIDALALSLYPGGIQQGGVYLTPYDLPADYIGRAASAAGTTRPIIISETGYGDSALASLGTPGSPQMQRDYVAWLLRQADSLRAAQVTWFFPTDPWGILEAMPPAQQGAFAFFGPMGMRKRTLAAKPALAEWDAWSRRPFARQP